MANRQQIGRGNTPGLDTFFRPVIMRGLSRARRQDRQRRVF
jgi:hypothetical protein